MGLGVKEKVRRFGNPGQKISLLKIRCHIFSTPDRKKPAWESSSSQTSRAPCCFRRGWGLPKLGPRYQLSVFDLRRGVVSREVVEEVGCGVPRLFSPPGPVCGPHAPAGSRAHKQIIQLPFVNPQTAFCHLIRKFILFCLQAL